MQKKKILFGHTVSLCGLRKGFRILHQTIEKNEGILDPYKEITNLGWIYPQIIGNI